MIHLMEVKIVRDGIRCVYVVVALCGESMHGDEHVSVDREDEVECRSCLRLLAVEREAGRVGR